MRRNKEIDGNNNCTQRNKQLHCDHRTITSTSKQTSNNIHTTPRHAYPAYLHGDGLGPAVVDDQRALLGGHEGVPADEVSRPQASLPEDGA